MVQPTTALCAFLLTKIVYARRTAQPPLQGHEMVYVVLIGTVQGFEIGLTNKALEQPGLNWERLEIKRSQETLRYLSVAARTMISSTSVLFMMCTARLWGLERLGLLRLCSSTLMILGGVAQCESPQVPGVEWLGILMQLTSMLLSAQRWAMAQVVLQSPRGLRGVSKLSLLARTLPITGAISMVLACIFEPNAMQALLNQNQTTTLQLLLRVVLVAVGLTSMLFAELNLVSLLSAVAFNVLSTLHQIPIVLAGVHGSAWRRLGVSLLTVETGFQ
ncbi:TPT domain-containing protein [Durusdinium trenchii]|uniref:TPT domain-containing protein n=1 Tax=Durusdinium trenchii TaxID=1381693 RepID=A0ABP0L3H5_9DINO